MKAFIVYLLSIYKSDRLCMLQWHFVLVIFWFVRKIYNSIFVADCFGRKCWPDSTNDSHRKSNSHCHHHSDDKTANSSLILSTSMVFILKFHSKLLILMLHEPVWCQRKNNRNNLFYYIYIIIFKLIITCVNSDQASGSAFLKMILCNIYEDARKIYCVKLYSLNENIFFS